MIDLNVIAQGYCTKINKNKIVDPDLMADCMEAILKHLIEWLESSKHTVSQHMTVIDCKTYNEALQDRINELKGE